MECLNTHVTSLKKASIKNSFGFSLIEAIIVASLLSAISLGMTTMIVNSSQRVKTLEDKLISNDTKAVLQNLFASADLCRCFIENNTFNYGTKKWNSFSSVIHSSYNTSSFPCGKHGVLLKPGAKVAGSDLKVQSLTVQDLVETTPGSGNFTSNLTIPLESGSKTMQLKPIKVPFNFSLNMSDPAHARKVASCSSKATSSGPNPELIHNGAGYDGWTGENACSSRGKKCAYVTSMNVPVGVALGATCKSGRCDSLTFTKPCLTQYNQSLPGVRNGTGTNMHTCDARIGSYNTFHHANVVTCQGHFSAVCL